MYKWIQRGKLPVAARLEGKPLFTVTAAVAAGEPRNSKAKRLRKQEAQEQPGDHSDCTPFPTVPTGATVAGVGP